MRAIFESDIQMKTAPCVHKYRNLNIHCKKLADVVDNEQLCSSIFKTCFVTGDLIVVTGDSARVTEFVISDQVNEYDTCSYLNSNISRITSGNSRITSILCNI